MTDTSKPSSRTVKTPKPLGRKAYGSIGHLPNSRLGPGDHYVHPGQARIATEKARDRHDVIIVQEKLDGGCVAVARVNGEILALGRAGYLASTSPFEQHHRFDAWVHEQDPSRWAFLEEGERLVGEWLAQAHGTRYRLSHEPFVPFDLMRDAKRTPYAEFMERVAPDFTPPTVLSVGPPMSVEKAMKHLEVSGHGALDPVEGAVWRVERRGAVDFLTKYVRPDKVDGCYLPEVTGGEPVWNEVMEGVA